MGLSFPIASAQSMPNEVLEMDRSVNSQVGSYPTEQRSDFEQGLIQKRNENSFEDNSNPTYDESMHRQQELDEAATQDQDQTAQMKQKTTQSTEGESLQQNREDGPKVSFTLRKDALSEKKTSRFTLQKEKSPKVVEPLQKMNSQNRTAIETVQSDSINNAEDMGVELDIVSGSTSQIFQSTLNHSSSEQQLNAEEESDQPKVKTKTLSPNSRELTITVEDLRTSKGESKNSNSNDSRRDGNQEAIPVVTKSDGKEVVTKFNSQTESQQISQSEVREVSTSDEINFRPVGETFSAEGGGGKVEVPVSREAANSFASYMKNSGKSEIVKNINFVLKDNNSGQIKLILKPESLGSVRIQLSLAENNISGKIFVDNSSVREIIQQNLNELAKSLEESGFNNAALDVFVSGEQLSGEGHEADENQNASQVVSSGQLEKLDNSVPSLYEGEEITQIDLVV